jgi:succinate-semialdehyde dehydrogenase/glutarate-semialdehyde dehydrogenase
VRRSQAAFVSWKRTSFAERSALLNRAAAVLRSRKGLLAALMTAEMGKPMSEVTMTSTVYHHCDTL